MAERKFQDNSGMRITNGAPEKEPDLPVEKSKKIISGTATKRKKSLGSKIKEMFLPGDISEVFDHLVQDILLPSAKELLVDMGYNFIDGMAYRDDAPRRNYNKRRRTNERVSYDRYSTGKRVDKSRQTSHNRRNLNFDEIILDTRGEAELVLDELIDRIDRYEQATVADLYDAVGWDHDWTEAKVGWYDLTDAKIIRVRANGEYGYSLSLPPAERL